MTDLDMEMIDLACTSLQNAVRKYCKKRKRDAPPSDILEHACHILRQLSWKRSCLEQGLTALESYCREWLPSVTEERMTSLLTHLFHQYLRLRDGLNLMTSGECRHAGDVKQAQRSKFKSQLNQQSLRGDGYTTLYSAKYYTGYGWDEFFDQNVGVLHRLQEQGHVKWDRLLDHGGQAFESCLDQHETAVQDIQSRLESLRLQIIKDLSRHCVKVEFLTRDKMERLQVTTKTSGLFISLQRRGKEFQLSDARGCLPNGWTLQDWKRAMAYVAPTVCKKPCHDKEKKNARAEPNITTTVNGLKLQVDNKKVKEETSDEISLNKVKKHWVGKVNAQALEKSRDILEAEDANVGNGKSITTSLDEKELVKQDVQEAKSKVQRFKRVLARVEERVDEFDHELWDARECLREACMTLGSHLLSLCAVDSDIGASGKNLAEARYCFREARDLVKKQESVHQVNCKQTNDFSEGARSIRRKLLLLRGRAHVNMAIALVELSLLNSPEPVRKDLEKEANTELESAQSCASAIRARATVETKGASPSEIAIDRLEADQLDALTNRWFGKAFWHQGRYKEAVLVFEKGSIFFIERKQNSRSDKEMQEAELELGVECFFASTSLADLALDALEKHQVVILGHPKREESLVRGQELFSMAMDAYKRASLISAGLESLAKSGSSSVEDALEETGIVSPKEIENIMEQITSWWDEKKQGVVLRPKEDGNVGYDRNALRNDLFSSADSRLQNQSTTPVKRFTINENSSRRPSRRGNRGGSSGVSRSTGTRLGVNGGSRTASSNQKVRYAKWGDDFLPQKKLDSGEMVPILPYPCRMPELPPGCKPFYQPKNQ